MTWAATSLPVIRRQWCNAIEAAADVSFEEYRDALPPGTPRAQMKKLQRLMDKFTVYADTMRTEAQALRSAELYWVSRDMVDVVLEASKSLPEWTPQAAMPAPTGLLCWAKSAGTVSSGVPTQEAIEMDLDNPGVTARPLDHAIATIIDLPWDAVFWWTRPDGLLQLTPASRAEQNASVLRMAHTTSPLWGAHTIMVRPDVPRTEEANGTEDAHPFVSALGAAWLLMAQTNVTETRTIGPPPEPRPRPDPAEGTDTPAPTARPSMVTIVDLLRAQTPSRSADSGRAYSHRFAVSGHWRQQACGRSTLDKLMVELPAVIGGVLRLRDALEAAKPVDVTLIDSPGSNSALVTTALIASSVDEDGPPGSWGLITCTKPAGKESEGIQALLHELAIVKKTFRIDIPLLAIVPCAVPASGAVYREQMEYLQDGFGDKVTPAVRRSSIVDEAYTNYLPIPLYGYRARDVSKDYENVIDHMKRHGMFRPATVNA